MLAARIGIVLFCLSLFACGPDWYQINQTIEMGPFVFEVTGTSERIEYFGGGGKHKKIYVDLLVHMDTSAPTTVEFGDFLNGEAKGYRLIVFPAMKIVNDKGEKFDGIVNRVSGETRWRAEFYLIDHGRGIQSGLDYLDRQVGNFQLVIKNPDPKKGQPRGVTIKLS
jgi:hypothetical protein